MPPKKRKKGSVKKKSPFVIKQGDVRDVVSQYSDNYFDGLLCDPPYALSFMGKEWDTFKSSDDPQLGYWLAGLADGEGCFRVHKHKRGSATCAFQIKLRKDDEAVLEKARRFIGYGSISEESGSGKAQTQKKLVVCDKEGCLRVAYLFLKFPLRSKKLRDFLSWADVVMEWNSMARGNRWHGPGDYTKMLRMKERIENARKYRDIPWSGNAYQDWTREWCEEVYRVLKPGAGALIFGGPKTHHRIMCAVEDAGFKIVDVLAYMYGSGFPKSHRFDIQIDKKKGVEPKKGKKRSGAKGTDRTMRGKGGWRDGHDFYEQQAKSKEGELFEGYGTALKPAYEPVILAMKPCEGSYADNALKHSVAGLNIDGTRIGTHEDTSRRLGGTTESESGWKSSNRSEVAGVGEGRWPANVLLDEEAAAMLDEQSGVTKSTGGRTSTAQGYGERYGGNRQSTKQDPGFGDSGGASRFFYTAKASKRERNAGLDDGEANNHPTVKPIDLCEYLATLILPPQCEGATRKLFVPFAGSGSEMCGGLLAGWERITGVEYEQEYIDVAKKRIAHVRKHGKP